MQVYLLGWTLIFVWAKVVGFIHSVSPLISAVSSPKNPALTRITLREQALTPTFAPLL